jgi:hypothetical protein
MKKYLILFSILFSFLSCEDEVINLPLEEELAPINVNGIPITYITTDNDLEIDSKDDYRIGTVSIKGGRLSSDFPTTQIKIRGRGNSTWERFPKKSYQLKFDNKASFLNLPEDKKWIFLAEYSDKTLMRNKIAFDMGYMSSLVYTPQSVYTDVYINNSYNGTYNISQKIEETNNRVALGDTGYLLEIDQPERLDPDDVYFRTGNYLNEHANQPYLFNIKEPNLEKDDTEYKYIKNLINAFETTLKSSSFTNPTSGYAKYIDIDSFIDYYLINEITKNVDAKDYSSIYINVKPGEKIKMGPIWDFDLAFGNNNYSDCEFPTGFWIKRSGWYSRLFQDPTFVAKVKIRFAYYKEKQPILLKNIDNYAILLDNTQEQNDVIWDLIGNKVWPNAVVFDTYKEEVDYLKSWYIERMNWLDTAINNL